MYTTLSLHLQDRLNRASKQALKTWDLRFQAIATAEELNELCVPLLQYSNAKERPNQQDNIKEEICDCLIMLNKMAHHFFKDQDDFEHWFEKKLKKLEKKLDPDSSLGKAYAENQHAKKKKA